MTQNKYHLYIENYITNNNIEPTIFTYIDIGIVKYHFELGAGKENFSLKKNI